MDLDVLTFDQDGRESLDAEAGESRGVVEQDGMLTDYFFQVIPDLGPFGLVPLPGDLDARDQALFLQLMKNERLEELQGHLLGQAALIELEFRSDNDDGPAGVIDPLAQKVLTEAPLFPAQGLAQRLERPAVRTEMDAASFSVVEKGVHSLLQHPLLVADDELGRLEFDQLLEAVVSIDHPAVEVVQVGGGEPTSVQPDQWPEVGRDDGNDFEDHPIRPVAGFLECLEHAEPFGIAELSLLGSILLHHLPQALGLLGRVNPNEEGIDGLGADPNLELVSVLLLGFLELLLVEELFILKRGFTGVGDDVGLEIEDLLQVLDGEVKDQTDPARRALEEPDVGHGRGQLDMAHPLPPHLGLGDLDAAALADYPPVFHPLVLAAKAFKVIYGPEYLGAEEPVLLRLEGPVVDGLGLGHLTPGPALDLLRGSDADPDPVEIDPGFSRNVRSHIHYRSPLSAGTSIPQGRISSLSAFSSSTFRQRLCSSRMRTLTDSGKPGWKSRSPLTMAS